MTGYSRTKLNRKINKFKNILSRRGITVLDYPSQNIAICNGGLANGLSEEHTINFFQCQGLSIQQVTFEENETISFVRFNKVEDGMKAIESDFKLSDGTETLMLWIDKLPSIFKTLNFSYPPGLIILDNFVSEHEEKIILNSINLSEVDSELKHRSVKHFGHEFNYKTNRANPEPIESIPELINSMVWPRLLEKTGVKFFPTQCTVNVYEPGHGIPAHVDTHSAFTEIIVSLSLLSDVVMEFRKDNDRRFVILKRGSLCVMTEESRYDWTHCIRERKTDIILGENKSLIVKAREKRISLTFRKPKFNKTCVCNNSALCDLKSNIFQPHHLEETCVHKVYDEIAEHFSETRSKPWPKVVTFLNQFPQGSLILDIGCGNGKYLSTNDNLVLIGCDRSLSLLNVCQNRGFNIFRCDCLRLPIRDNFFDGCICIAVLHHLSSKERRIQALKEMIRVLKPSGKVLIYVWAKDQTTNEVKSSYLKQKPPKLNQKQEVPLENFNLPVHTNRTNFQHADILVPWKDKKTNVNTYFRYYHVFEETELKDICMELNNVFCIDYYYDNGNFCAVLKKSK